MVTKKNIQAGKIKLKIFFFFFLANFLIINHSNSQNKIENFYTEIKILDKISSKNILLKLKNEELNKFQDLAIKSLNFYLNI